MAAGTGLSADQLLRDLANLWVTLGKQGEPETGMGVLRACSLNLVVLAEEADDFQELGETLAAVMPEHPARAIVIRLHAGVEPDLTSRVFSQCWMPFGQRRQICCEQIEITASQNALEDAIAAVGAVAAPDLPVIAWCRSARLVERAELRKLSSVANRILVDSAGFADAKSGIARLAGMVAQNLPIGDLSWTRLTRWREMLSQSFENRERLAHLPRSVQISVGYGGKSAPVPARYMGAWLAESLKAAGVSVSLSLHADPSASEDQLSRVELTGAGLRMESTYGEGRVRVAMDGLERCAGLPPATDYLLMREELGIVRRDPVFERTLRLASVI